MKPNLPESKALIIRFSSIGDIIQCAIVPMALKNKNPNLQIHFLVRSDFSALAERIEGVNLVINFERAAGFSGLWKLAQTFAHENYDFVYDAHNNLRSNLLILMMRLAFILRPKKLKAFRLVRRSKERFKRYLLFAFRINLLPTPYIGSHSYLRPLRSLVDSSEFELGPVLRVPSATVAPKARLRIGLIPSAAWFKKVWPLDHFSKFIANWPEAEFWIFGGPADRVCQTLADEFPDRVKNLAGDASLVGTLDLLKNCDLLIGNDTGFMHAADQLKIPSVFLIGPSAFGYPFNSTSQVAELELPCKPCSKDGRGKCTNTVYKRCLVELTPELVREKAERCLKND